MIRARRAAAPSLSAPRGGALIPLGGLALLLSFALAACGGPRFGISGTITLASNLRHKAIPENSVLFVVALNRGGVPVAVRRIVNPQFPVSFTMSPEDLIVPVPKSREPLLLRVQLNTHGNVGTPLRGDLEGSLADPVAPVSQGVHIVIDRQV